MEFKLVFIGNGDIKGFIGCLRNLKYEVSRNGKTRMKSLGTKWERNNKVIPCSEKVEPGYFFGRGGGRIRAEKRFRVGLDFDITMMIKPRNLTGILAAVRGRRDYLVLAMNEGAIEFTVDNGRGPIQATFQPGDKHEFCNGEVSSRSNSFHLLKINFFLTEMNHYKVLTFPVA